MEITQKQIDAAYKVADENTKKVLDALFGEKKDNRPVTERIKTFEDACEVLNQGSVNFPHILVAEYNDIVSKAKPAKDVVAYMKLRIIVAALNEGWKPKFEDDEYRYAPWFILYTQAEMEELDENTKACCRVVGRSNDHASAYGGVAFASAYNASSSSHTINGSRLAFKSEALAEYAGKQFIDIYIDFMMSNVKA